MAKDANEETQTAPKTETAKAPKTAKKDVATFNQEEPEMVKVKAAEGTQMYNPVTQTLYTADEAVEASMSDQFIVTNLARGKLKKSK